MQKIIENIGIKYFSYLSNKEESFKYNNHILDDKILRSVTKNITINSVTLASLTGAIMSIPIVLFIIFYKNSFSFIEFYLYLSIVTIICTIIEFLILYWISIEAIYTISVIANIPNDNNLEKDFDLKHILVRTALEIPDPVINYLGIDITKNISKKKEILFGIIYKAKVVLTSITLKLFLKHFIFKATYRDFLEWISVFVTAIWDGIVMYYTIKQAKIKLFGYQLSQHITYNIITKEYLSQFSNNLRIIIIRAISIIVSKAEKNHINNALLLNRFIKNYNLQDISNYDDEDIFFIEFQKLKLEEKRLIINIIIIAIAFDGNIYKDEKNFLYKLDRNNLEDNLNKTKEIVYLLESGRINKLIHICEKLLRL